jgi:hypothetical protein
MALPSMKASYEMRGAAENYFESADNLAHREITILKTIKSSISSCDCECSPVLDLMVKPTHDTVFAPLRIKM